MKENRRIAILVAGMHRSGTSALTRILSIAGCDLPDTLVRAKRDNPSGFWESQPVADLNKEILASAGSSWDDWRLFPRSWYRSPVAYEFRERATRLLQSEFGDSRLFVLKEPRLCRLLRFWVEIVDACDARPLIVLPIRNPFDVASSLQVRNDLDPGVGQLVWLRYVLDAEAASRGMKRSFLRYEKLLTQTHSVIERLEEDLGIALPKASNPFAEMDVDEFLSPTLHHHSSDDMSLRSNPRVSDWIKSSFEILDRWSHGDMREEDTADLDRIKAAFDEATPAFSRAMAAGQKAQKKCHILLKELAESQRELAESQRELAESQRELAESQRELEKSDAEIRALSEDLEVARWRHIMALAHRGRRLGRDTLEVNVLLHPGWVAQVKSRAERNATLELRCNGKGVASIRVSELAGDAQRIRVKPRIHTRGELLYSIHDTPSGETLAALATPAFPRARLIVGGVESRDRPEVRGWVLDQANPEHRRRVAFHVDGHLRDVLVADLPREDIARTKKTGGRHGFLWRIPEDKTVTEGTRIDVFDAATGRALEGSPLRIEGGRAIRSERSGR